MIRTAVLGATGIAGQQFLAALKHHPYIEVAKLAASSAIPNDAMLELLALPIELLALPGIEPLNRFEIVRSSSPLLSGRPVQISIHLRRRSQREGTHTPA